jgi:hypothetical protein
MLLEKDTGIYVTLSGFDSLQENLIPKGWNDCRKQNQRIQKP